jgi:hypothetical protein
MAERTVSKGGRVLKDISGQRFGKLAVIGREYRPGERQAHWRVRCDCGGEAVVRGGRLRNGRQRSCGCDGRERVSAASRTHGRTSDSIFTIWSGMRQRTRNPNSGGYENYGGRGVTMCDRWFDSFEAFLSDMGERPSELHSIERIKNDRGYAPGNCRWATGKEQCRNRRNNHIVIYRGKSMTLMDACEKGGAGISWHTARNRIERQGWSVEQAVESRGNGRGKKPG